MIKEIDSVLSLLDDNKDMLLISLLNEKKSTKVFINDMEFDSNCIKQSERVCNEILDAAVEETLENTPYYQKIKKILSSDCDGCKHAEYSFHDTYLKDPEFYERHNHLERGWWKPKNSNITACVQCFYRSDKLDNYKSSIETMLRKNIQTCINREIIETKAMIFIIQQKLKEIKTNK